MPERDTRPDPAHRAGRARRASPSRFTAPDEPLSCRSVWQMRRRRRAARFPWAPGYALPGARGLLAATRRDRAGPGSGPRPRAARAPRRATGPRAARRASEVERSVSSSRVPASRTASASRRSASLIAAWSPASSARRPRRRARSAAPGARRRPRHWPSPITRTITSRAPSSPRPPRAPPAPRRPELGLQLRQLVVDLARLRDRGELAVDVVAAAR